MSHPARSDQECAAEMAALARHLLDQPVEVPETDAIVRIVPVVGKRRLELIAARNRLAAEYEAGVRLRREASA